eukprot:CFRG4576T1
MESFSDVCSLEAGQLSNTFSANPIGRVAVIGRGPYGVAMFEALAKRNIDVIMGIRTLNNEEPTPSVLIHPDSSVTRRLSKKEGGARDRIKSVSHAISLADVIILSIPSSAHNNFVQHNAKALRDRGKAKLIDTGSGLLLIDTSNTNDKKQTTSVAERLQMALANAGLTTKDENHSAPFINVTKGFNTVSAYSLGNSASLKGFSDAAPVCGDNEEANAVAIRIGTTIGLRPFDIGPLCCARDIEKLGFSFFSKWGRTLICTNVIFFVLLAYVIIWYMVLDFPMLGRPAYSWAQPAVAVNKAMANTSLVLLTITYLPGKIANLVQLYKKSARKLFPCWLSSWLQIRKQLGLMACWLMVVHAILTAFIKGGTYGFYSPFNSAGMYGPGMNTFNKVMNIFAELVLLLGVFSGAILIPVLLSSLPSVGRAFTSLATCMLWIILSIPAVKKRTWAIRSGSKAPPRPPKRSASIMGKSASFSEKPLGVDSITMVQCEDNPQYTASKAGELSKAEDYTPGFSGTVKDLTTQSIYLLANLSCHNSAYKHSVKMTPPNT